MCGDKEPWTYDKVCDHAHNACNCPQSARDDPHSVRAAVHVTDSTQCTVLYTVWGDCSWALFTNNVHGGIVKKKKKKKKTINWGITS